MSSALLLLHGNNLDETLWLSGAILLYLTFLFISSQLKTRRLKKEKLRRKAERAAQRAALANIPPPGESDPKAN